MHRLTGIFAAAVLSSLPCLSVANAQEASPPGLSTPAPEISDQKLDAAAAALMRVASVKQDFQQKIQTAPPNDQQRIVQEANDALVKAVEEQGLSVEEYNSIIVVAQNDSAVREKIMQRLRPSE